MDLDNEETWHAHADHRVNIDKEDESRLERYRKTLWRVQRFRGVHWPSLDEAYQQPNRKRAIPSSELVARLCGPETTLAHHRYTNTLYKHVLHAMFGMGLRPPGEFAVLSLGSVKWTQDSGESFTAQTIYDAAVAGRAHDVERLWGIARQTQGYVTVLQPKKRGKRDYIRGPVPFPAWVLSAPNGRSILNYVVHHRPKIARRPGISVTTDRLFIQWNGEDYAGGEDPGHGLANGLARAVKRYWPEYTNYSARHFYATTRLIETYTRDKRFDIYRVAKELGDTVRTVERTYVPQANEILQLAAENAVNKRFRGKR